MIRKRILRECSGEVIGTFILVFIGCGSVGMAEIMGWLSSLWQVAAFWGIAVTLAIMAAKKLSASHFNPAVTLSMCMSKGMSWNRLLPYSISQLIGAILAGILLLYLFSPAIGEFEKSLLGVDANLFVFLTPFHTADSALMFGEFFPNPGYADLVNVHWILASVLEGIGAFLLITFIFRITTHQPALTWKVAAQVGLVVALLICIIAPFTQCGMNPARDLGPRLVAYFFGWGEAALPDPQHGALTVYVIGPFLGAIAASLWENRKD